MSKLDDIERRLGQATQDPWHVPFGGRNEAGVCINGPAGRCIADVYPALDKDNAAFIIGAREDVPYLLKIGRAVEEFLSKKSHPDSCFRGGCDCGLLGLQNALDEE
jgi:hypothetical protein